MNKEYEAILITHTEIGTPVEADFTGLWRQRVVSATIHEIPSGGTTNQVIRKLSNDDYDFGWGESNILIAIPAADKSASGTTVQFTANEAQAFGDVVRINSAGKAQIAKANVIANATAVAMLISESVEADAPGNYLLMGFVRNDAWNFTVGSESGKVFLSLTGTTGNTLTQTNPADIPCSEDNVIQLLGVANSSDSFYFNPQLAQVEYKA
jgi:hypothetical protein